MGTKYVVDTHALIWHLEGRTSLGSKARTILNSPDSELLLPMIALAEAVYIVDKGRTSIPSVDALIADVIGDPRIDIVPLTLEILKESLRLTSVPEMHDRLIVATGVYFMSRGEEVQILTKDNEIVLASLLPVTWA